MTSESYFISNHNFFSSVAMYIHIYHLRLYHSLGFQSNMKTRQNFVFCLYENVAKKQKTIGVRPISRIIRKCWNTKWSLRSQLSTTCLSLLCSTWCVGLSLELFEFHKFNIRILPKEASNKNEIFLWLEILEKHSHVWVPRLGLAWTSAPVCKRVETHKHWNQTNL